MVTIIKKILHLFHRKPDFIVGSLDNPYLYRWYIIPRNCLFNIYLHKFLRDDDERALHDHPWVSLSIILKTGYLEYLPGSRYKRRNPGKFVFRKATQAHRIKLLRPKHWKFSIDELYKPLSAWSLFITGPKIREWGFHCPRGWRHWREFCDVREGEAKGNEVGKGCA